MTSHRRLRPNYLPDCVLGLPRPTSGDPGRVRPLGVYAYWSELGLADDRKCGVDTVYQADADWQYEEMLVPRRESWPGVELPTKMLPRWC